MSYGADMLQVTEDTFKMIKAATSGIDTSTGIAGIDFLPDLMSWVPVDTPFFNSVPRGKGKGSTAVFWQTLLNINAQQNWQGIQKDYAAQLAKLQNQYTYSPYAVVGQGGTVTWDAIAQGEDYTDVLAVDTLQTINQQLIALEVNQLNSAPFALPTIATPTVTAASTGGSIPTESDVYVRVQARSGMNWYTGGSGVASTVSAGVATTGPNASITATVAQVKSAAGYDWFVGTTTTPTAYAGTTYLPTITITSLTALTTVPTGFAGLYEAGTTNVPTINTTTDTSYQTYWQQGLVASILGDWSESLDGPVPNVGTSPPALVTPGSGVSQGAYYASLNGSPLTVQGAAFEEVDAMDKAIYDKYQVTPSRFLMGSQVITDFANAFLDNPQAVLWYDPAARDGRLDAVMGGHVATYANKTVNGKPIPMWLMPYLPPGKIVAVIDSLPFPGSNVTAALQARTLYDFYRFDYGANRQANTDDGGPRYDFEVRTEQAFVNKASGVCGVIEAIGAGA